MYQPFTTVWLHTTGLTEHSHTHPLVEPDKPLLCFHNSKLMTENAPVEPVFAVFSSKLSSSWRFVGIENVLLRGQQTQLLHE